MYTDSALPLSYVTDPLIVPESLPVSAVFPPVRIVNVFSSSPQGDGFDSFRRSLILPDVSKKKKLHLNAWKTAPPFDDVPWLFAIGSFVIERDAKNTFRS